VRYREDGTWIVLIRYYIIIAIIIDLLIITITILDALNGGRNEYMNKNNN